MKRRNFIKNSAIGSACALVGPLVMANSKHEVVNEDYICKITILKRTLNADWNKEIRGEEGTKCHVFEDGQEFMVYNPWEAPEGFCHWAWADIRTFIHLVQEGRYDTFVSCCTDGFRPVFFKIERILK